MAEFCGGGLYGELPSAHALGSGRWMLPSRKVAAGMPLCPQEVTANPLLPLESSVSKDGVEWPDPCWAQRERLRSEGIQHRCEGNKLEILQSSESIELLNQHCLGFKARLTLIRASFLFLWEVAIVADTLLENWIYGTDGGNGRRIGKTDWIFFSKYRPAFSKKNI